MKKIAVIATVFASFALFATTAHAQSGLEGDRILVGGSLGFPVDQDVDFTVTIGADSATGEEEWEHLSTPGLFAEYDYAANEFFQIGGRLGLNWWLAEELEDADKEGPDLLVDIAAVPKVRYQFSENGIEIFGAVPIGLVVAFPHSDWEDQTLGTGVPLEPETTTGWMIGVKGGVVFDLDAVLLFADVGWTRRAFTYDFDFEDADASAEWEIVTPQFGLSAGVAFGL